MEDILYCKDLHGPIDDGGYINLARVKGSYMFSVISCINHLSYKHWVLLCNTLPSQSDHVMLPNQIVTLQLLLL